MNKVKVGDIFLESTSLIAQTFNVNNLGDISTRQGGVSNKFTFPLTAINREALGFPEDPNETLRNPYKKVTASLHDGNQFLATGFLKIEEVTNNSIKATFFSDNSGWFNLVKDKTLKDLNLTDLNHTLDGPTIRASFSSTDGYVYPIIDYGEFKTGSLSVANILPDQLFPAVYVKRIFQQIFDDIGYEIDGEMLDLWEYNNMIIPFSDEDFTNTENFIQDNTLQFDLPVQTVTAASQDVITVAPATVPFSIPTIARYEINLQLDVTTFSSTGGAPVTFGLNDNFGGGASFPFLDLVTVDGTGLFAITVESDLDPSDNDFFVEADGASNPAAFTIEFSGTLSLTPLPEVINGGFVEVANILPEIKQSDFIKYMCNLFGVIVTTDPVTNNVSFDLFRNIKGRVDEAKDWSYKIDIGATRSINFTEIVGDYGNRSVFKYLEDDDDTELKTYKSVTGLDFGSGELLIDNEHIANKKEVYEAPFGGMINIVSFSNELYIPQIRWREFLTGEKDVTPIPRVGLILTGLSVSELTGGFFKSITIDGVGVANIPFVWFSKAPYTPTVDEYNQSLAFGDILFTEFVEGTLANYWDDYKDVLSNIKFVRAFLSLNAVDISELNFKIPIYIDFFKSYFYINAIKEYTGSDQLTEVELIKLV